MSQNQFLIKMKDAWNAESYSRFIIPIIIVSSAKLLAGLFLYHFLGMGQSDTYWMTVKWGTEGQNDLLVLKANQVIRWPYLFIGWDSAWYLSILAKGYVFSSQSYAFFPGLPLFSWLLNLIINNPFISLILFSFITGIAWLPVYQLVAESYMGRSEAMKSTLIYGFFPCVFLFSTVAYTEGLFLLSTLSAWYFFRKNKLLYASIYASIATLTRSTGILIMIPIFIEVLGTYRHDGKSLKLKNLCYLTLPAISFTSWLYYCKLSLDNWVAPFTRSYWDQMYSFFTLLLRILSPNGIQSLLTSVNASGVSPYDFPWIAFVVVSLIILIILSPILIRILSRYEKSLAIYSAAYFLGILAFGSLLSIPRFISFLPLMWMFFIPKMSQPRKSKIMTITICALFYFLATVLWYGFLTGGIMP